MSDNVVNHVNQGRVYPRKVEYKGTADVTQGYFLNYDLGYYTAEDDEAITAPFEKRSKITEQPDKTNNTAFAGVALQSLTAKSDGLTQHRSLEIAEPGSCCLIYVNEAVTIGDRVCPICSDPTGLDAGQFTKEPLGHIGMGCATVLESGDANTLVLALLDPRGIESGQIEYQTLGAATGAHTFSVTGLTIIAATALTADATFTLADGKLVGERKAFYVAGDLGDSKDLIITVASGLQLDGSTALATWTADDAADYLLLEWQGTAWREICHTGGGSLSA